MLCHSVAADHVAVAAVYTNTFSLRPGHKEVSLFIPKTVPHRHISENIHTHVICFAYCHNMEFVCHPRNRERLAQAVSFPRAILLLQKLVFVFYVNWVT